jgi:hypothetical protein
MAKMENDQMAFDDDDWVIKELDKLLDEDCVIEWRIGRLYDLVGFCIHSRNHAKQVKSFADFLAPIFPSRVQDAAAECIRWGTFHQRNHA